MSRPTSTALPRLYSPEDLEKLWSVKASTVREWARRGVLPGFKLNGKVWRFREADLLDFIEEGE
jgi:excisionase family DNA binding protein